MDLPYLQKNNLKLKEIPLCLILHLTIFTINNKLVGSKSTHLTK